MFVLEEIFQPRRNQGFRGWLEDGKGGRREVGHDVASFNPSKHRGSHHCPCVDHKLLQLQLLHESRRRINPAGTNSREGRITRYPIWTKTAVIIIEPIFRSPPTRRYARGLVNRANILYNLFVCRWSLPGLFLL